MILDYDVTRYHSFDFFRFLLYDKSWFMRCNASFLKEFVELHNPLKQIRFYMKNCTSINPFDLFSGTEEYHSILAYEDWMNEHFDNKMLLTTPTDIAQRLSVIFDRNGISGYILKYAKDPFVPDFGKNVKLYTTDHVMDLRMAVAIIEKHSINAVMVANVELATILAVKLQSVSWTNPISFMIGTYRYNYDPDNGMLLNIPLINSLEFNFKHEFGVFDPFTGLEQMNKEGLL